MKPQKALHLYLDEEKKYPKHIGHNYAVFEKFDGWYMYIDCIDGEWQGIRSKTGRLLPSMAMYSRIFENYVPAITNGRLIFEAIIEDENGKALPFAFVNGRFNQKREELVGVTLQFHDLVDLDDHTKPFQHRFQHLKAWHSYTIASMDADKVLELASGFKVAELKDATTLKEEWYVHYNNVIEAGGEGVILKRWDAPYSPNKRNADLLKIKCDCTFDLKVIGGRKGKGKYANTLGYLVVEDAVGNHFTVSGMSDDERMAWFMDKDLIVNKIVEVQAMKVIKNTDGTISLREPRYKAIRHDKTEVDEVK